LFLTFSFLFFPLRDTAHQLLSKLLPALHAAGFQSAFGILTAAVPIIKLTDHVTGFEVDISHLQPTALPNVRYVKQVACISFFDTEILFFFFF
jgi:DNA polymerase sigma